MDGFTPTIGQSFTILAATTITGTFDRQDLGRLAGNIRFSFQNTGTELIATAVEANYADFATWQAEHFSEAELLIDEISGRNGNPDGDELSNFFEFLFGTRSKVSDVHPMTVTTLTPSSGEDPARVKLTFPWRQSSTETFSFQDSMNLESWENAAFTILEDIVVDGVRQLRIPVTTGTPASVRQFVQMLATEAAQGQ